MSAHTKLSAAVHNMQAAGHLEVEAGQIATLMKGIDAIVEDLLKDAWKGSDALSFGRRCQSRLNTLDKVRTELLACASLLQAEARRLQADAALEQA